MDSFTPKVFALLFVCISLCNAATPSTITINATIYDHSSLRNPDFENTIASDKGLVTSTLGGDRKPIYAPSGSTKTVHNATTFNTWFRDTPDVNTPIAYAMKLTKSSSSNIYTFSDSTFFPIDGKGFGNEGRSHNYHFCLEIHSTFSYEGGETFSFTGDDDVFVYINNKLVIDLGGIHSAQSKSVALDTLGLVKKNNYKFDLFFCERHTTQSNLKLQTSIQLYCQFTDRCGVCEGDGNTCPCTCNDGDECTLDSCDAISGNCVYSSSDQCSSAGDQSGWANTANLVGIVVGGTAFVGIATVGGKKAYDRYNGRKQPQPATTDTGLFYKWALRAKGGPQPAATV